MIRRIGVTNSWANALVVAAAIAAWASAAPSQAATLQVGFSPEGTARTLVLSVIESAKREIRMLGYSFTSADIIRALIAAKRRGVDVQIVLDQSANTGRASVAAMNRIVNAGIALRIDNYYEIAHDKVIVADGQTVETGSFNYTSSAEHANSENALVIWNYPQIATPYLKHWQTRWEKSTPYRSSY
ncbi:endonuclease Nuc [Caballeronia calidae]|uniref:phospholipase D n=1 Tax=Caballeronia calidae TaxID=1777139 RepID=A0A158EJR1_9BURK|nr:phospholipase D family protein [Caballeronia calidae]SAL07122.1 endonuclease Nuc [Caballeronia calidae]